MSKTEPDPAFERKLAVAKAHSTGQLLFKAARLLDEQALARVRARTGKPVRPSHTAVLPHLDLAGTRLTTLADRLGITKQAVGQTVQELEDMGVVERVVDPSDGRAKLVRFTALGRRGLLHGLGVLGTMEEELARRIGAGRMKTLHGLLTEVVALLEARASRATDP